MVLTCQHVLDSAGMNTTIRLPNGKSYPAEYLAHDKTNTDLAIYVATIDSTAVIPVGEVQPAMGESLIGVGYSDGTPRARYGRYDGANGDGPNEKGVTFQVAGGDSGGGVFSNGMLVGVINKRRSASYGNHPGPGLVISQPACRRFFGACLPLFRKRFQRPDQPPPMPPPDTRPPIIERGPQGERGPAGKDGRDGVDGKDADIAAINKTIVDAIAKIKAIPGERGPQGFPGKDGANGKDGSDADVSLLKTEIEALKTELNKMRNAKFIAELLDANNVVIQRTEFGPNDPLRLRLVPTKN